MIDFTPLLSKPKKPIMELYPFLWDVKDIDEFEHPEKDKVLHYMLLAYHVNSPMIEKYTSIPQRKEKSALLAGFSADIPKYQRIKETLFDHTDEAFVKLLHNFLVSVNNRLWTLIVVNETIFAEYQFKLITPLSMGEEKDKDALTAATIKGKLMDEMDRINGRLETYYQRLYMGDEKLIVQGTKRKGITPESAAKNVPQA